MEPFLTFDLSPKDESSHVKNSLNDRQVIISNGTFGSVSMHTLVYV
jgi:hypothetical protein